MISFFNFEFFEKKNRLLTILRHPLYDFELISFKASSMSFFQLDLSIFYSFLGTLIISPPIHAIIFHHLQNENLIFF